LRADQSGSQPGPRRTAGDPLDASAAAQLLARISAIEAENAALRRRFDALGLSSPSPAVVRPRAGQVVVVASAQGGAGKSFLASGLATGLVKLHKRRTVLVDANLYAGDQDLRFRLKPQPGLAELAHRDQIDVATARELVVNRPSGPGVVVSPSSPMIAEQISADVVAQLVRTYAAMFSFVVVDTRAGLDTLNLKLLEAADRVLLVTLPEPQVLAAAERYIDIARALGYDGKLDVIVNQADSRTSGDELKAGQPISVACTVAAAEEPIERAANAGGWLAPRERTRSRQMAVDLRGLVEMVAGRTSPGRVASPSAVPHQALLHPALGWLGARTRQLASSVALGLAVAAMAALAAGRVPQHRAPISVPLDNAVQAAPVVGEPAPRAPAVTVPVAAAQSPIPAAIASPAAALAPTLAALPRSEPADVPAPDPAAAGAPAALAPAQPPSAPSPVQPEAAAPAPPVVAAAPTLLTVVEPTATAPKPPTPPEPTAPVPPRPATAPEPPVSASMPEPFFVGPVVEPPPGTR
jgi:MinD-like ATPase involved in chromosome partitioning or flagellar assembly